MLHLTKLREDSHGLSVLVKKPQIDTKIYFRLIGK
jgi:hypothetical protein